MTIDHKSYRHAMSKRVETKDDGRIIIYYTFGDENDTPSKESKSQTSVDLSSIYESKNSNITPDKSADSSPNLGNDVNSPRPEGKVS